ACLPTGFHFALTTQVHDDSGHFEQVFIRVDSIVNARVFGIINNDIYVVRQYRAYMPYAFTEDALLDWTITDPNGVEVEGNFVGRYFDKFQGRPPCSRRPPNMRLKLSGARAGRIALPRRRALLSAGPPRCARGCCPRCLAA